MRGVYLIFRPILDRMMPAYHIRASWISHEIPVFIDEVISDHTCSWLGGKVEVKKVGITMVINLQKLGSAAPIILSAWWNYQHFTQKTRPSSISVTSPPPPRQPRVWRVCFDAPGPVAGPANPHFFEAHWCALPAPAAPWRLMICWSMDEMSGKFMTFRCWPFVEHAVFCWTCSRPRILDLREISLVMCHVFHWSDWFDPRRGISSQCTNVCWGTGVIKHGWLENLPPKKKLHLEVWLDAIARMELQWCWTPCSLVLTCFDSWEPQARAYDIMDITMVIINPHNFRYGAPMVKCSWNCTSTASSFGSSHVAQRCFKLLVSAAKKCWSPKGTLILNTRCMFIWRFPKMGIPLNHPFL